MPPRCVEKKRIFGLTPDDDFSKDKSLLHDEPIET